MLIKDLSSLAEQQEKMVEQGDLRAYIGLCMQEAAILKTYSKEAKDEETRLVLLYSANEAMNRAIQIDISLNAGL